MALAFLVILYTCFGLAAALSKEGWRSQSIYQLLTDRYARTDGDRTPCTDLGTYCGGTWRGIINNLDYIQGMGFTAVWISPVTENIQGNTYYGYAFHGFWPQKINQLNSNFGTAADLKALSDALHARGMYLMIDMVTNFMAWNGNHTTIDYSIYDVFNDPNNYHSYCPITNYEDPSNAVPCWEGDDHVSLPDLKTEDPGVLSKWENWVSNIIKTYGIDGIRLDSCREQNNEFFTPFENAAGVYIVCEVYNYYPQIACPYQNYVSGFLNYPIWNWVVNAFGDIHGSISDLYYGITAMQGNCTDVSLLANFVENHDIDRLPAKTSDPGLDQNAIAFVMLNDGIPIIYAGEEQHYSGGAAPANRETTWTSNYDTTNIYYQLIQKANSLRSCVIAEDPGYTTAKSVPFFLDTQVLAVKKGSRAETQIVGVFNNRGVGAENYTLSLDNTGWTWGDVVYEVYTGQQVTITLDAKLPVDMYGGQPRMYYLLGSLNCSGVAGPTVVSSTASVTSATAASSAVTSSSVPGSSSSSAILPISTSSSLITSSAVISNSVPGSSSSSAVLPGSSAILSSSTTSSAIISSTGISNSVPISPSSSAILSSSTTSSVGAPVLPFSSIQVSSSSTSTSNPISATGTTSLLTSSSQIATSGTSTSAAISVSLLLSGSGGNSFIIPASTASVGLPAIISPSAAPAPATAAPICPSADGNSFISSGQEFVVGCGIGSDQTHFAQLPGTDIADCVHKCTQSTATPACEAVTYSNGVCYLKSNPGPVHNLDGSDSAFVISTPNGPETVDTVASSYLSGNISQGAPTCPDGNGNTFQSNGFIYVVGCSVDSYVVDISTAPGADLASCVESCIFFSGTTACAAVTHNNGNCHFKGSVGTVFHAPGAETVFIIANPAGVNPGGLPSGPLSAGNPSPYDPTEVGNPWSASNPTVASSPWSAFNPTAAGNPWSASNPTEAGNPWSASNPTAAGNPSLPSNPTGTYTIVSGTEVVVYMPLNEICP